MRLNFLSTIVAIVVASPFVANAEQISVDAAKRTAERFVSSTRSIKSNRGKSSDKLTLAYTAQSNYNEDENCYYVFNRSNGGFVIASADDCAQQILGTSDEGTFDYEKMPENMQWWLSTYQEQISQAMQNNATAINTAAIQRAARNRTSVNPLCTTKWDQGKYYNSECPVIDGKSTYTGCVATAIGQVMKYHNWPEKGIGSVSYKNEYNDTEALTVNFEESPYDWSNMPDQLTSESTPEQVKAVSHLLYQCAAAVYTTFGTAGSSAYLTNIVRLYEHMGYSKSVSYRNRNMFNDAEWETIIYNEISNNRPVCYSGGGISNRHAFVCDGYNADDNTFHLNWGWSGNGNGYFKLSALEPFGAEKTQYVFNKNQGVIIGIQKPTAENNFFDAPIVANGNLNAKKSGSYVLLTLDKLADRTVAKFQSVANYAKSITSDDVYNNLRVKLVNTKTMEVSYITTDAKFLMYSSYNDNASFGKKWNSTASNTFKAGNSYEATPEYKTNDSDEWKPVIFSEDLISKVIITRNENGTYSFEQVKSPAVLNIDNVNVDKAVAGKELEVDITLSNLGQSDYDGELSLYLIDAEGNEAASFAENADVPSKTTQTVNIIGSLQDIKSGSYSLRVSNNEGATINDDEISVTVKKSVYTGIETIDNRQMTVTTDGNTMNVAAENDITQVEVYNMAGALMASISGNRGNSVSFNIDSLNTGIYAIKATSNGKVLVEQILVKK